MRLGWVGLGRACTFLLAVAGLCACVAQPSPGGYARGAYAGTAPGAMLPSPAGRRIAVLVPITGASADLGQSLARAARLALEPAASGMFDLQDTKSTPEGAAAAAEAAMTAGAGIIVGPLTASETGAVTPIAHDRGVPVLAFTSDISKAQPGIWPMGLTPGQQVRTLVQAVRADGKSRIGAVLPRNPFGDALSNGLMSAAEEAGLPPPQIVRYTSGGLTAAIEQIAGPPSPSTPAPGAPPAVTPPTPAGPPPIDALLFAESGDGMLRALPTLNRVGLGPDRIRLLGTALWSRDSGKLAPIAGAWFAGPNPDTLHVFEQNYMSHYGTTPRDLASIAFDAAGAARAVTGPGGVDINVLLNSAGFAGANGVFSLLPDGRVLRSLAVFEIGPNGARVRNPGFDNRSPAASIM